MTGRIVKATAGFYYVRSGRELIECRARGVFRKRGDAPLVGDMVELQISREDGSGTVSKILPRKNSLIRPPLSNLDRMVMILSVTDPVPNLFIVDSYLCVLRSSQIDAVIALTKTDLANPGELARLYRGAGYPVHVIGQDGEGLEEFRQTLTKGISAFCGNSGVGKSTLLNRIDPRLALPTGETSQKLGRGRHTTRHVELLELNGSEDGLVADTPGFSSIELLRMGHIPKGELADCFPELADYLGKCKFNDCSHTCETGCGVLKALGEGKIDPRRHENYCKLYAKIVAGK